MTHGISSQIAPNEIHSPVHVVCHASLRVVCRIGSPRSCTERRTNVEPGLSLCYGTLLSRLACMAGCMASQYIHKRLCVFMYMDMRQDQLSSVSVCPGRNYPSTRDLIDWSSLGILGRKHGPADRPTLRFWIQPCCTSIEWRFWCDNLQFLRVWELLRIAAGHLVSIVRVLMRLCESTL